MTQGYTEREISAEEIHDILRKHRALDCQPDEIVRLLVSEGVSFRKKFALAEITDPEAETILRKYGLSSNDISGVLDSFRSMAIRLMQEAF